MSYEKALADCAVNIPDILLPKGGADLKKWAVIACDQFSSDSSYWERVKEQVDGSPSTLELILPECYLAEADSRVPVINRKMKEYLDQGILESRGKGFVYLNRSTPFTSGRKGLVVAIDLEDYSYEKGAQCQIRPTEATVLERLPVRAQIRKNAVLDIPHILILIDDPEDKLFRTLEERKGNFKGVYNFDLTGNAGHIEGLLVSRDEDLEAVSSVLTTLNSQGEFLFAVGDGNHSLGAAKQLWEKKKAEGAPQNHPSRYAMVEIENIHDRGVHFHPIHRVLFDCPVSPFMKDLEAFPGVSMEEVSSWESLKEGVDMRAQAGEFILGMVSSRGYHLVRFASQEASLSSEAFHLFLDPWMKEGNFEEIDYIHGEDVLLELARGEGNLGFYLPCISKESFFKYISTLGPMPRKTFSIGEAEEKRYYLECRRLIP